MVFTRRTKPEYCESYITSPLCIEKFEAFIDEIDTSSLVG